MCSLTGKVALITGGLGGIGVSYAQHLMANKIKGIVLADASQQNVKQTIKNLEQCGKGDVKYIKCDVTIDKQLRNAFEFVIKNFNHLDIFINNAAILNESHWMRMIQINLLSGITANYLAMKEYLPKYKSGDDPTIVNTLCVTSLLPLKSLAVYSSTKAGMMAVHKSLSNKHYYTTHGCRFLAICPGLIRTPMLKKMGIKGVDLDLFDEELCETPIEQMGEQCGKCLIQALRTGKNGSIWICEENKIYEWTIPDRFEVRKSMRKQVNKDKPCS